MSRKRGHAVALVAFASTTLLPPPAVTGTTQPLSPPPLSYGKALDFARYDRLRLVDGAVSPSPEVTLVPSFEDGDGHDNDVDDNEGSLDVVRDPPVLALRHLAFFAALTRDGLTQQLRVDTAACALLAVYHWNGRIDDVVPQVREATRVVCPDLKFTLELFDSEFMPRPASRRLAKEIFPRVHVPAASDVLGADGMVAGSDSARRRRLPEEQSFDPTLPYPTSMTGALRSVTASALSILGASAPTLLLPLVSSSSTSEELDDKGVHPLFGRTMPSNKADAYAAIDYLSRSLGVSHVGVLYVRDTFGLSFAQAMQDAAVENDPPVEVVSASYPYEAINDPSLMGHALERLRDSRLNYFFLITFDNLHQTVMAEAYKHGVAGPGKYWMYGKALDNDYVTNFAYPAEVSAVGVDDDASRQGGGDRNIRPASFVVTNSIPNPAIAATHGAALLDFTNPYDRVGQRGHDAFVKTWRDTIKTRDGMNYLGSLLPDYAKTGQNEEFWKTFEFSDVPALYGFNQYDATMAVMLATCERHAAAKEEMERSSKNLVLEEEEEDAATEHVGNVDTKIMTAAAAMNPALFSAEEWFDTFVKVTLDGAYGHVSFDHRTGSRDYRSMSYTVLNVLANDPDENGTVTFRTVPIDVRYDGKWIKTNDSAFVYSDGTYVPPKELPDIEESLNLIPPVARAMAWVLCGVDLALSATFGLWTWWFRHTPVVLASQGVFLGILCVGTFVIGVTIIPMSIQEPMAQDALDAACTSIPWLISFGFTTAFASLFSKLLRVNKIFHGSMRFRRHIVIRPLDVIKPFAGLFLVNVTILVTWTIVSSPRYIRVYTSSTDMYGRKFESYGTCFPPDLSPNEIIFLVLWALPNAFAWLFANYQAYRARIISVSYSESSYIGMSTLLVLQIAFIGVPSIVAARDSPTALLIIGSFIITAMCCAILLPIFIPKSIFLRHWKKQDSSSQRRVTFSRYLDSRARQVRTISLFLLEERPPQLLGEQRAQREH